MIAARLAAGHMDRLAEDDISTVSRIAKPAFPPGPKTPIHNVVYAVLARNVINYIVRLHKKYGDIIYCRTGTRHDYLISDPDLIRDVLLAPEEQMFRSFPRAMRRAMGNGLLSREGTEHRMQRRSIQPHFHHRQIAGFADTIIKLTEATSDRWKDERVLDVDAEMRNLVFGIIARIVFGDDAQRLKPDMIACVERMMQWTNNEPRSQLRRYFREAFLPRQPREEGNMAALDSFIYRIIEERRESHHPATDLVSMFIQAEEGERGEGAFDIQKIRDEVVTMIFAGHETVGVALTWTWHLLSQHPDIEARFHGEVDEVLGNRTATMEDLPRLKYTSMILSESMRIYPPIWQIGRRPLQDWPAGQYVIPAGSFIHISPYLVHHDGRHFPDPERFDPLRWLPENVIGRAKFSYFPFAAGGRKCVGEELARMEGVLILATLAQRWRLQRKPGHRITLQALVTLRPRGGLPMTVQQRKICGAAESSSAAEVFA